MAGLELLDQVPLGVRVLGEDKDAAVVPVGPRSSETRAEVVPDPGDQMPDAAIGFVSSLVGDMGHLVEELKLRTHRMDRASRRGGGHLHLGVCLGANLLLSQRSTLVVGSWRGEEKRQGRRSDLWCRRSGRLLGLPFHRPAMDIQSTGKGFDGGKQPLLERDQHQHRRCPLGLGGVLQSFLPGLPVLLEQVREDQFWGVLGQPLDVNADDLPLRELLADLPEVVLEPPDHHRVPGGVMYGDPTAELLRIEHL